MITQRDLSRLATRLYEEAKAAHGKKALRVAEDTVERDYCLAWLLCILPSHDTLRRSLAFKGGTALRRIHYGEYRFSEDLDFTLTNDTSLADILAGFRDAFASLERQSGIRFALENDGAAVSRDRGDTFYFTYQGPRPAAGRVKVDVTRIETIVFPLQTLPVLRSYTEFDFPEDREILVYSLDEIAVEKILAVTDGARREPRDLYDLWHMANARLISRPEDMVAGLSRKLVSRPGREVDVLVPKLDRVERALKVAWERRLVAQVAFLPPFDGCFRDVRRLLLAFDDLRR
jgi:uncharacterized protein